MRGPKPPPVELSAEMHAALVAFSRRPSTPQQLAVRARIVLAAARGLNNGQIRRALGVSREMVRLWRARWLAAAPVPLADLSLAARLSDTPRAGRPARIPAAAVCQIVALACEAPASSGRPISQWSSREIADEVKQRGIVADISPRHAARLLKRGISSPTGSATG